MIPIVFYINPTHSISNKVLKTQINALSLIIIIMQAQNKTNYRILDNSHFVLPTLVIKGVQLFIQNAKWRNFL